MRCNFESLLVSISIEIMMIQITEVGTVLIKQLWLIYFLYHLQRWQYKKTIFKSCLINVHDLINTGRNN